MKPGQPKLYAPHIKFNREIGRWAGQKFHAQTGEPLDDRAYAEHLKDYMPSAEDKKLLLEIIGTEKKWIAEKVGARDPLASIGEVQEVGDQSVNQDLFHHRGTETQKIMAPTFVESKLVRLTVDVSASVARLVLRNPPLNVIDIPMMEELAQALAEIEARADVSVVVLSGEGRAFSAGVDVAAHTPDKVEAMLLKFHAVIRALVASKKVTVAAVHGHCLGGGAELAMVCDMVYTTGSAQWGFPEIKLGCYPPVACTALAALVGQKRAAELILTGRTISGMEAAGMGLATSRCSR